MLKILTWAAWGMVLASSVCARELTSIGVTLGTFGNPYFVVLAKGVTDRAQAINPDVKVTVVASEFDLNRQFSQIDTFISAKVDLILLSAADAVAISPAIKRAQAAGIPVIAVDATATGADATVMTDNVKAGVVACQFIADRLTAGGKVVIVNGPPHSAIQDRVKGCREIFVRGQFEILSDNQDGKVSREGGLTVGQGLMTRFPRIDAIFAVDDQAALGVDLAAKQLRRSEFMITSVDASPEGEVALKTDTLIQASAAQDPYEMGVRAVEIGAVMLKTGKKPNNPVLLLDPVLVTRDNVSEYRGWEAR